MVAVFLCQRPAFGVARPRFLGTQTAGVIKKTPIQSLVEYIKLIKRFCVLHILFSWKGAMEHRVYVLGWKLIAFDQHLKISVQLNVISTPQKMDLFYWKVDFRKNLKSRIVLEIYKPYRIINDFHPCLWR